jgi:dihydrofolate reductase
MTAMSKLRIHNFSVSLDGYIRLAGGASAIQQYLRAGLVDEMHLAYAPVLLGSGERLFDDLADAPSGYQVAEFVGTPAALHVRFVRKN